MKITINKQPTYKALCRDKSLVEARLYPPSKRTVYIAGREYFLQIPSVIGSKVVLKKTPHDYWAARPEDILYSNSSCFLNFCFEKDGYIYPAPFSQVDYVVNKLAVCLTSYHNLNCHIESTHHIWFSPEDDLNTLMYWFWNTSFATWQPDDRCRTHLFGNYHKWQDMDLNGVLKCMTGSTTTIKSHIKSLRDFAKKFK
jgi:hypothetical protein